MWKAPALTGNLRHRWNWLGKFILQVEEEITVIATVRPQPGMDRCYRALHWRDARPQDLPPVYGTQALTVAPTSPPKVKQ